MNEYIKRFTRVIRNCRVDNTYKMAWGKAIVELSIKNSETQRIEFREIAETIFKAFGRCLRAAVEFDPRMAGVLPSTKGKL